MKKYLPFVLMLVVACAAEAEVGADPGSRGAAGSAAPVEVAVKSEALTHQPPRGQYTFDNIINLDFISNASSDCQTLAATLRTISWQDWMLTPDGTSCVGKAVRRKALDFGVVRNVHNCRTNNSKTRVCDMGEGLATIGSTNNSIGNHWEGVARFSGLVVAYSALSSDVL